MTTSETRAKSADERPGTSDQRLSKRLRSETKALHTAAERSGVMRMLARDS